jgi:hypothetical protein
VTDPAPYAQPDPYSRATPAAQLRAPEGTDPYTPWIWLILVIPVVQFLPVLFIDWDNFVRLSLGDGGAFAEGPVFFSPAFLALQAASWIGTALMVWFAYLDWRELNRRGVPQPFHWAWIFLTLAVSYAVYTIGRSVVVQRRTGRGIAPMWITIATLVAGFIASITIGVVVSQLIIANLDLVTFGP